MERKVLSLLCISLISISIIPNAFPYTDSFIPPTIAFSKIYSGANHIQAKNYYGKVNITAGAGITVSVTNGTTAPSITIANSGASGLQKIQGSNLGTHGVGPFVSNFNASMLQFLSLVSLNSNCVITSNSTNVILNCSGGGTGTVTGSQNVGRGTGSQGVLSTATATTIKGKNVTAGSNISLAGSNSTDIVISASGSTGVTSLNFTTNGDFDFNVLPRSLAWITLDGQVFNTHLKPSIMANNLTTTVTANHQYSGSNLLLENPAKTFDTALTGGAVTANRTLNLPLITGTDTLGALGLTQTWTGSNNYQTGNTQIQNLLIENPAKTFATTIAGSAQTANRTMNLPVTIQTETFMMKPVINSTASSNKTGTTTFNLLGDGVTLTPTVTGRASITVSGYTTQSTAASGGAVQIRQITGGCPGNAAAVTGTALGSNIKMTHSATTTKVPFSITVQTTGLTINQKYCFELSQQAITSGTFTVFNVMWAAEEI